MILSVLNSVYGEEFGNYTYIVDCKVLTEKNRDQIYSGRSPVKLISCIPDNFGAKLSEKSRNKAYLDNNWNYIGICCQYPSGKGTEPEYWSQVYHNQVFGHPMWIHIYRKAESEKCLERYLNEQQEKYCTDLAMLTPNEFICEPDARKELEIFEKSHKKLLYSTR